MSTPSHSPWCFSNPTRACKLYRKKHKPETVNELRFNSTLLIRLLVMLTPTHSSTTTNLSPSEAMQRPLVLRRPCSIVIGCLTPDWNQLPSHLLGKRHASVERSVTLDVTNTGTRHTGRDRTTCLVVPMSKHHSVKTCWGMQVSRLDLGTSW